MPTTTKTNYPAEWTDVLSYEQSAAAWQNGFAVAMLLGSQCDIAYRNQDAGYRSLTAAVANLDTLFDLGQNDFAPKKCRSLMVGDVIITQDGLRALVCPTGFRNLTAQELAAYVALTPHGRGDYLLRATPDL